MRNVVLFVTLCLPALAFAQAKKASAKGGTKTGSMLQVSLDRGKTVYNQFCLTCHQADGSGVPNMNPPLTRTKWVLGAKT
ncbi:MAG TPA: cytochrome c, partial [Flavisolibacter sp.]|nr:cytochrome c [Flavisolibacter sp.]